MSDSMCPEERRRRRAALVVVTWLFCCGLTVAQGTSRERLLARAAADPSLELREEKYGLTGTSLLTGSYRVWEDREARSGRTIDLHLVVLPAQNADVALDPVFVLHGGPGAAATAYTSSMAVSWLRARRDIVLVDQRGTGGSNPLQVELPGSDEDPEGYLEPIFVPKYFTAALPRLREVADLTKYTTPIAMDDLSEVREALGYGKINLRGGSYGSRAALVYLRRHPETVRTATLSGIAPFAFTNPLYHAISAQEGLDVLAAECAADPRFAALIPDLGAMVEEILAALQMEPARVQVRNPATEKTVGVSLSRDAFAEALRVLMYTPLTNRQVPSLVERAHRGNYAPFAQIGLETNRALRGMLCFGMLMCVTNAEDLPRIDPASIPALTAITFLGDVRVRGQLAVGEVWPRAEVPADYAVPVDVDVPVLLWSGTHDPVTPPRWGAEAASHLPHGLHLVVPGAHGVAGPGVTKVEQEFLKRGTTEGLDLSPLEDMRMPPLAPPVRDA